MYRSAIFIGVLFLVSCNANKAEQKTAPPVPHGYYYYPKPNVYYDTTDKSFIYFDTLKKDWVAGNLPAYLQADLGKSSILDSATQPVWLKNKEHRLLYAAILYADSSDFKKSKSEKEPKRVAKKQTTDSVEKKKKGKVGEFFRKIFRKKKDEPKD